MRKIKDVLRLKLDAKLSHQQIVVVTKYAGLAAAAGLDWPAVQGMDEAALERRLLVGFQKMRDYVRRDYGRVHQELRRKGMTLMLLWEEHRANYADGQTYAYSQYCENYRRFAKQLKRSMRQVHRASEKLFIDYAGPTIALADGGRASRAHGVDAATADPLGRKHWPGERRGGDAPDGGEQASGARLPRLPWCAVAGQALRQGAVGGARMLALQIRADSHV